MEKTATPQAKPKNKHFWNFQPASGENPPELILYGDIASETWWGDEVTPRQFTEELDALGAVPEIVVRINSGGGDVFAANAIYTRLKDNAAKITVKIDGWAASAATIIAMAGDSIEIPGNGVFMVHDPALGLLGYFNEAELAKMTDELKVIKQSIVNAYTLKTGKDAADVAAIMAAEIVVRINSGGGDVFAANAIYTRLKDNAAKITVKIDGWAASAATIIAMAGDSIEIPGNGVFMVHDPALGLLGYFNEAELAKMTDELKVIKQSIVNAYTLKTGKDAADVAAIMAAETWYDGKQAVDAGFCDKLMFEDAETTVENAAKVVVNSVSLDLTRFPNMPVSLLNRMTARTPGGFSNKTNHKNTEKERNTMDGIEKITTVDGLKAAFPDLTRQIEDAATTAERKRIQDIEDVALAGYESIVNDAKFNNPIAAGDVAKAIVAAQKKQGGTYIKNRDDDAQKSGAGDVGAGAHEGAGDDGGDNDVDKAIDKLFPATK